VGGPGINAKRFDHRVALQDRFEHLRDVVVVLAMIALRILLAVPEADGNHPLGIVLRDQTDQVNKTRLLL